MIGLNAHPGRVLLIERQAGCKGVNLLPELNLIFRF